MDILLIIIGSIIGAVIVWFYREETIKSLKRILEEKDKNFEEQKNLLTDVQQKFTDTFKAISSDALRNNNQTFLESAKKTLEIVVTDAKGDLGKRQSAIEEIIKPLKDSLNKYEIQLRDLEKTRADAYGGLNEKLERLENINQLLQKETITLSTALRTPQAKAGNWGEITLRKLVEITGMSKYCDFVEQLSVETEDGRLRPDLIVKLPGNKIIIVDAKTPRSSYMEAIETSDDSIRKNALERHASVVRKHMISLSSKAYWSQFPSTPDWVVMFLPGEFLFSAAVEYDRTLIEDAIKNKVMISTPTNLAALLMTIAYTWRQQDLEENAKNIAESGKELFERMRKFVEHFGNIKNGLDKAVESYNSAVGSLEKRIIPCVRKLKELGAASPEDDIQDIEPIEKSLRAVTDLSIEK